MNVSVGNQGQTGTQSFSGEQLRAALDKVLRSDEFKGSARMRSFLSYVVTETLEGRSDEIRAKTIAMDVYGYDADELLKREGVVRVDAGRVRRKLQSYYDGKGIADELVISLPVGGYAPEFLPGSSRSRRSLRGRRRATAVVISLSLLIVSILFGVLIGRNSQSVAPKTGKTAIYDVSPARVEAMNLSDAGRDLIFPVTDLARLQPALLIFKTAIERDPLYYGGYAGASQVETMLAIMQSGKPGSDEFLHAADKNSAYALEMAPNAAWSLSARAWFEFGVGNYESAVGLSQRAVDLAPDDSHVAEFDALISLYTSDFDRVLSQSVRYRALAQNGGGLVFDNALGAAQFHTGDYAAAIRTFDKTISRGGPFGPISAAYLMAAHWRNGEQAEAQRLARVFSDTWPSFPLEKLKARVFVDPQPVQELISAMIAAGWSGPAKP
ncbi:adenylate cyclase [Ruegeria sp. HKCCE3926]|uniref:tetratricopeptide repeat protein n=1 Tax=Ruegeria sp. HKCCE3926 TaxID=2794831 RepID=UPI001FD73F58|nr:adenylate cyclase [Ruegeria sp. HKCCE3926]